MVARYQQVSEKCSRIVSLILLRNTAGFIVAGAQH